MLTRATGNSKYLDIMHSFFDDVTAQLWDKQSGLYYRDDRFIGKLNANGKKIFWSRGNGWVFAGIPRIRDHFAGRRLSPGAVRGDFSPYGLRVGQTPTERRVVADQPRRPTGT